MIAQIFSSLRSQYLVRKLIKLESILRILLFCSLLSLGDHPFQNPATASRKAILSLSLSMAALSIGQAFHTKQGSLPRREPSSRTPASVSCQRRDPSGSPDSDDKRKATQIKRWMLGAHGEMEKVSKYLKDNLSPKQKGDWKDLLLVSFSFAVYVYISQLLVCAYFAHISMLKQFQ